MKVQEKFDEDLGRANQDRSFRFRMRDDAEVDWSKVLASVENVTNSDDPDEEEREEMTYSSRMEMLKWKIECEKKVRLGTQTGLHPIKIGRASCRERV